ncbi:hypothetical protein BDW66DRAFT_162447 [Aspergillus desertorum]
MEGYDKLAALMTAEIAIKEKELEEIMHKDIESGDKYREKYSSSVRLLKGMDEPSEQWRKWLEIRELLEKYNTAFTQHTQLLRLKPPHKHDLNTFKDWLDDNPNGDEKGDLVALSGRYENVDLLTKWVFRVVIPLYDRIIVYFRQLIGTKKVGLYDEKIIRATRLTSTITSSVIPASSMLVLYLVSNMITRLIIIVVYNIGFSIILGLLAKARRVEVFAASTAFAAVQVAFITNFPHD